MELMLMHEQVKALEAYHSGGETSEPWVTAGIEERLAGRRSSGVAFSDTKVLQDDGVMEEALKVD